jgi:hypothetical protein
MTSETTLPILNSVEIRLLGALMEKSKTTPEYYPLTLNSLTAACNQKSSRKPVVVYNEETIVIALNSLKSQSLVSTSVGGTNRTIKYKHNVTTIYPLTNGEFAIMCLLFLRGPQTPGELNTNSGRLHEFSSIESVVETLQSLSNRSIPFVKEISKRFGQKEVRFKHLFGNDSEETMEELIDESANKPINVMETRITQLETELAQVKELLEKLTKELLG